MLDGGFVIYGKSNLGDEFFIPGSDSSNINYTLPNGVWNFSVIGWKGATAGPMTGINVCASQTGIALDGANTTVNFNLTTSNCSLAPVAGAESFSTTLLAGEFKKIDFISCLTIAGMGVNADLCDNSSISKKQGVSTFIKVEMKSSGTGPVPATSLSSICLNLSTYNTTGTANFNNAQFMSPLKLPVKNNSLTPFPIHITSYNSPGCLSGDEDIIYFLPNGLGGAGSNSGAASKAFGATATLTSDAVVRVAWADNYIGAADSTFRTVGNDVILPFINCTGPCSGNAAIPTVLTNDYPRDIVKGQVFRLFGTPDMVDFDDRTPLANAVATYGGLTFTTSILGAEGNNLIIFTNAPGALSVTGGVGFIDITASGASLIAVKDAINALSGTTGITASCGACAGTIATAAAITPFSGGTDQFAHRRRMIGDIPEVKELLLGPLGGLLFENGITTLSGLCSATALGSYFKKLYGGDFVTLLVEAGDLAPPAYMTNATGGPFVFDRKLTLQLNGVSDFSIQINCPAGGNGGEVGVGWFAEKNDGTLPGDRAYNTELFFNHTASASAAVEAVSYGEDNASQVEHRGWRYFQKTGATTYQSFTLNEFNNGGSSKFMRAGAKVDTINTGGPDILINTYDVAAGTNADTHFSGIVAGISPTQTCSYTNFTAAPICGTAVATTALVGGVIASPNGTTKITAPWIIPGGAFNINSLSGTLPLGPTDFSPF